MALLVDRAPQVMISAIDGQHHLVQMPFITTLGLAAAQRVGIGLPKLQSPLPDALVCAEDPPLAISSSMSRKLSEKRKYSHTAWLMMTAG